MEYFQFMTALKNDAGIQNKIIILKIYKQANIKYRIIWIK